MKFLAFLFLVGFASASFRDVLDDAADEVLQDYVEAIEFSPSLKTYMEFADEVTEDDIKTEIGKKLKEHLNLVLEKIREAIDRKQEIKEDLIKKAKEIREQLKDLHIEVGNKAKELLQKIKEKLLEKGKELWNKFLEKFGLKDKEDDLDVKRAINLREAFRDLKKSILENIDKEALKEKIEKIFGKRYEIAEQFLTILREKGEKAKQKLLELINKFLGEDEPEKRSLAEYWELIKNYFKNLHIELKEKYLKFGEWVKDFASKHLEKGKSKLENLKQIAKEMIDHAKDLPKEVAVEALEFLRPYKEDFGSLWDQFKESMKDVLNRKEK